MRRAWSHLLHLELGEIRRAVLRAVQHGSFVAGRLGSINWRPGRYRQRPNARTHFPDGYVLRRARLDDLPACAAMAGIPMAEYLRRHEAGDICYAIFHQQQPAAISWLHFGPCYVRGLGYRLDADEADCYAYGGFAVPAYRGKGLYKFLQRELIQIVRSMGSPRMWELVMHDNPAIQAMLSRLGYEMAAALRHVMLLGVRQTTIRDARGHVKARQWGFGAPPAEVFRI